MRALTKNAIPAPATALGIGLQIFFFIIQLIFSLFFPSTDELTL